MLSWKKVPGWLTLAEGQLLQDAARGQTVLEIGSLFGRSTICLAEVAWHVVAVDPHNGSALRNLHRGEDTLPEFLKNLAAAEVNHKITVLRGPIEAVAPFLTSRFGLVFIDGDHSAQACRRDLQIAERLLSPKGQIAVHDYGYAAGHLAGVQTAVDEFATRNGWMCRTAGRLALLAQPAS